ncbi:MAG: hypothetical protein A2V93_07205 [Ignavibacteria bacterium RBG_16_34_14]|nr:MAG: hypothetical protein A2V93_07205 [Ignavibacteria bacterium RBG_16_34_14]
MKKYFYPLIAFVIALLSFIFFPSFNGIFTFNKKSLKPDFDKHAYPYEWAWLQRTYPYFNADPKAYIDAIEQVKEMKREQLNKKSLSSVQWEFAGPINIGGRVVDIEFNPLNPSIVYAASATGGVFKSTDTGVTWFPIFDDQNVLPIGDIAVDPVNPNIVFVGTGEANGGHNNFAGGGVFKSTDAGSTWQFLGLEETVSIGRIVIDPTNTNIIYLAAVGSYFAPNPERGIYKSTDGGNSWFKSLFVSDSTGGIDIVMDPTNPSFLMAAMWERVRRPNSSHLYGPSGGIYRTTNGGNNWELLGSSTGLPNANTQDIGRIGLAMSKSNPEITYALYNDGAVYLGLYKTTDYGNTWINADPDNEIGNSNGVSNFSWYFGQVRIHPTNPQIIYVMDVGFMRTTNSGANWSVNFDTHVDHHALAFHPTDPNYIINGNDGGINISTNAGIIWSEPAELPNTQFYEIGLDLNNPQKLYGGTQDNNTIRTNTGGLDDWDRIIGGDGFYVNVDFTNPNIIYGEWQFGNLEKSIDGGLNFSPATNGINGGEPTNWSTPVIMAPHNPRVLYYGTDRVYRTINGAASWTAISDDLTNGIPGTRLGTVTTIAVAPSDSNVIYAGTDDSHVWVTTDYGNNWTDVSLGPELPDRWVTRVVVDPEDANIIYATFSGLKWRDPLPHVFKSTDMGSSWTNISYNLPDAPVNAFAVDNNNPDWLYVGSDVGAFVSFNGGISWEVLGIGLPVVSVYDMKIHPTENYLAIGTHGRSMYRLDLNQLTVGVDEDNISVKNFELFQNYPNPFNPTTKIKFVIPSGVILSEAKNLFVTLKVYDILGREVATLVNEEKSPGEYEVEFDASQLSSGIYFYKLEAGNYSETKKMVLLK